MSTPTPPPAQLPLAPCMAGRLTAKPAGPWSVCPERADLRQKEPRSCRGFPCRDTRSMKPNLLPNARNTTAVLKWAWGREEPPAPDPKKGVQGYKRGRKGGWPQSRSWSGSYLKFMLFLLQSLTRFLSPGTPSFASLTIFAAKNKSRKRHPEISDARELAGRPVGASGRMKLL